MLNEGVYYMIVMHFELCVYGGYLLNIIAVIVKFLACMYILYYELELKNIIMLIAIVQTADPSWWQGRLKVILDMLMGSLGRLG